MRQSQILAAIAAVTVLVASSALAQKPATQAVKGKIAAVEGSTVVVDQAKGAGQAKVKLNDKAVIMTVGRASLAEIRSAPMSAWAPCRRRTARRPFAS
jgi:hypothetical protein